ncbi:hypothetical protein Cni_G09833 [Canna indica]|uniref:Cyclin N-terminal domain-containing protein n=1 Tax=Canna indica TaxID=4628 RepID=A0AAQ3K329_9LILI|nr:hypothetical protein Cni_G09833 [Canna indica]
MRFWVSEPLPLARCFTQRPEFGLHWSGSPTSVPITGSSVLNDQDLVFTSLACWLPRRYLTHHSRFHITLLSLIHSHYKEAILGSRKQNLNLFWLPPVFDLSAMGVSYKCASSILLCPEDTNSILGFEEEEGFIEQVDLCWFPQKMNDFYRNIMMDFTLQSEDCIALLMEREAQHLPQADYTKRLLMGHFDMAVRSDAIDWIQKVHVHHKFGPLTAYVSVNYLDRFLSCCEIQQGKAWMTQLLSVACLSLAVKVEETHIPLSMDLQACEPKHVFDAKTIQRMELLVLSTLKWRMQVVTPFSFIHYFLCTFRNGNLPNNSSISHSVDLILKTIGVVDFLEFRPSEIAAAVALSVLNETKFLYTEKSLDFFIHVKKERVLRCHKVIQEMTLMEKKAYNKNSNPSIPAVPKSPIGVLDSACLSSESGDITAESHGISYHHLSPAAKRRKLNRLSTS